MRVFRRVVMPVAWLAVFAVIAMVQIKATVPSDTAVGVRNTAAGVVTHLFVVTRGNPQT